MQPYNLIFNGLDVSSATLELMQNINLFGEINTRKSASKIHSQMEDIWLRYQNIDNMIETGDYSRISDEHDSTWLKNLPHCKRLCFEVMRLVDGERLGGVLITKLPPKGNILPHTDGGWHAEYYDKYYIPIVNDPESVFCFDEGEIHSRPGDIWAFDNSYNHWVKNNSKRDRIAMIVCIKQNKYDRSGKLCHGE